MIVLTIEVLPIIFRPSTNLMHISLPPISLRSNYNKIIKTQIKLKIKIYTSFPFSDFISKPVENEGQDF
jgi:hypothetical protein